jgi:hypothetical protein
MADGKITQQLRLQLKRDRELIEQELPELAEHDARMKEAAAEETLCGTVRRAIHQSRRPLRNIAAEAGVSATVLCDFLEGERTLRSDVLDRITQAVHATVSMVADARP